MRRHLCILLSVLFLAACQSNPAAIDYDTDSDFSHFRSYHLAYTQNDENSLMQKRLVSAVNTYVSQTGLVSATDKQAADLIIQPQLQSTQRTQEPSSRGGIGVGGGSSSSVFGISLSIPLGSETIVNDVVVAVQMVNAKTDRTVWQGQSSFTVAADDPAKTNQSVDRAVQAIFAQYPPKPEQ